MHSATVRSFALECVPGSVSVFVFENVMMGTLGDPFQRLELDLVFVLLVC